MNGEKHFDDQAVCDRCGRFGAFEFGDERLCVDCYETQGSCCLEFGGDDLWDLEELPPPPNQECAKISQGS